MYFTRGKRNCCSKPRVNSPYTFCAKQPQNIYTAAAEIGWNQSSLMKSNNVRAVKLFIERKRGDNKSGVTTRDHGSGFSEYRSAGIFFRLREFMKRERERRERKKKRAKRPFRPVKILRWPRCFVYWSLFTRKSFMVLSHFAACRSGTNRVIGKRRARRATFTNRRSFSFLKKVLKPRPFDGRSSLIASRPRKVVFALADNSKLLLKPLSCGC